MALEKDLQTKIIQFLKRQGCIAYKMQQNATTRTATPDVFFIKDGFWGAIEVKKTKTSKFQPGQKEMVAKLNEWSWAKVVWGGKDSNWEETKKELSDILR